MTEKEFKRPSIRYRRRHIVRQLFAGWPWLVWLAAAIMVMVLLPGGWHRVRFYGEAERTYEYIAPLVDGRLVALNVQPGDLVHTNQLVGELDSASLEADWLMDQASLMKTHDRIQQIQCEIQEKKLQQAETQAKLKELEGRWIHTQDLLKKKLILEQEVEDLRPQIKATKEILAQYPALIDRLNQRLALAEKSASLFSADRLEELKKAQYQLLATTAGVVSEVLHRPGDIVKTGDPIARISNVTTSRIIAFLPAETRIDVEPGKSCQVISSTTREIYQATVESVTADIRKLPMFTGFGDRVQRGRRVLIILNEGREITPGERVVVVPDRSILDQWFGGKK
jgi:multidrug resistance efflux pump